MPQVPVEAQVIITTPDGLTGGGTASAQVNYVLNEDDRIEIVMEYFNVDVLVEFAGENAPVVIGGWLRIQIDDWEVDQNLRGTLQQQRGRHRWQGKLQVSGIPQRVRDLIEGASRSVNVAGSQPPPSGSVTPRPVEPSEPLVVRSLPAAFDLVQANEHIADAKELIQKYINQEPEPDLFALAVLEGLQREVDSLGDQLAEIVTTHAITPQAEQSLSIIDWIARALIVKQGAESLPDVAEALVEALKGLVRLFG